MIVFNRNEEEKVRSAKSKAKLISYDDDIYED